MKKIVKHTAAFYRRASNIIFWILLALAACALVFLMVQLDKKRAERAAAAPENEAPKVIIAEETLSTSAIYNKLMQMGLDGQEIAQIVKKLDSIMFTRKLRAQDKYTISLTEDGKFNIIIVSRDLSYYYVAKLGDEYVAGIIDQAVSTRQKSARGDIESSLFVSMVAKGMNVPLVVAFTDVFSWNIDFNSETRNGDEYAVVWDETATTGGAVVGQNILAAKYKGSYAGENYAFFFNDDFYDENGKVSKRLFLKSPISFRNVRITSRFTNARKHPVLRTVRPHLGIDYAAPRGTPVETVADGTVKKAMRNGGFGNYVEIAHSNGFVTTYGHLQRYIVKPGQKVRQGAVIGYVGNTGLSTGPHLDFRIKEKGKFFDFLKMKNRNSAVSEVPKDKKAEFEEVRDKFKKLLDNVEE